MMVNYSTNVQKGWDSGKVTCATTVEPPLSGPPLSGLAVFFLNNSENGRVPPMRMRVAAVTMETCLLIFCACADNHVALLFINKVGGPRRGLSIRLSGLLLEPRCPDNRGFTVHCTGFAQGFSDQLMKDIARLKL